MKSLSFSSGMTWLFRIIPYEDTKVIKIVNEISVFDLIFQKTVPNLMTSLFRKT